MCILHTHSHTHTQAQEEEKGMKQSLIRKAESMEETDTVQPWAGRQKAR